MFSWLKKYAEVVQTDVRSLAVFRVCLGILILLDMWGRSYDIEAHYTDDGILPIDVAERSYWRWLYFCVHNLDGSYEWTAYLFFVQALLGVALILGYGTRLVTFVSWLLYCSLHARQPILLQSGDTLLRMMLFWALFLPMGAAWSLDARNDPPAEKTVSGWPVFAMMLQTAVVYWFAIILRIPSPVWFPRGNAVFWALNLDAYTTDPGLVLREYRWLLKPLTYVAYWVELLGPIVAFSPWKNGPARMFAVVLVISLHVGLDFFMYLGLFPLISITSWMIFIPTWFWDKVEARFAVVGQRVKDGAWPRLPLPVTAFVVLCTVYCTMWNIRTVDAPNNFTTVQYPKWFNHFGNALRLDQYWAMFSPAPPRVDGWFVAVGMRDDFSEVNLRFWDQPPTFDKPDDVGRSYVRQRWRKYLFNAPNKLSNAYYADYLKRKYNEAHPDEDPVTSVRLVYVEEWTKFDPTMDEEIKLRELGTFRSVVRNPTTIASASNKPAPRKPRGGTQDHRDERAQAPRAPAPIPGKIEQDKPPGTPGEVPAAAPQDAGE